MFIVKGYYKGHVLEIVSTDSAKAAVKAATHEARKDTFCFITDCIYTIHKGNDLFCVLILEKGKILNLYVPFQFSNNYKNLKHSWKLSEEDCRINTVNIDEHK